MRVRFVSNQMHFYRFEFDRDLVFVAYLVSPASYTITIIVITI